MTSIKVTNFYGFIFRKDILKKKSITLEQLEKVLGIEKLDENDSLVSFKPCFGGEAANNLMEEVNKLGLEYVDDYFLIEGDFPEWLSLRGELKID
jgi:hypothetical protein